MLNMTKDQERAALAKIKKIIEEAGNDSYLSMTFDGIIEQCEENISNDWACNYKDMFLSADLQRAEAVGDLAKVCEEVKDLKEQMKTITGALEAAQAKNQEQKKAYEDMCDRAAEYVGQIAAGKNEISALNSEIIELKAKLYDLMTA